MKLTEIKPKIKPPPRKFSIELTEAELEDVVGILENALWEDFKIADDICQMASEFEGIDPTDTKTDSDKMIHRA